eukprot:6180503-Pleurochrysis_carterae.AAC.2
MDWSENTGTNVNSQTRGGGKGALKSKPARWRCECACKESPCRTIFRELRLLLSPLRLLSRGCVASEGGWHLGQNVASL